MKGKNFLYKRCIIGLLIFHTGMANAVNINIGVDNPMAAGVTPTEITVRSKTLTMHDGTDVEFWTYCTPVTNNGNTVLDCSLPGPTLELDTNQTAFFELAMMPSAAMGMGMWPHEMVPVGGNQSYMGHTIHSHGLDVSTEFDGVPETNPQAVVGDASLGAGTMIPRFDYQFKVDNNYIGSHMYHCHVHTVKHLEMGMYGAFIVRDPQEPLLINSSGNGTVADHEWVWLLSTVDPSYHDATAVGDNKVFADYNPKYFLLNGQEGVDKNGAVINQELTVAPGDKIIIRLMGLHSVNAKFEIRDEGGILKDFELHNIDGFALPSPQTVSSVELSPGQTKDILVTVPNNVPIGAAVWTPQVRFFKLRRQAVIPPADGLVEYAGSIIAAHLNIVD